ncbi:serine/threonine protein kinase [Pseudomonas fluorescens]|uniref:Serine/threonine protein kinase n=1 Tax=Pseudomonas fluorescens TaxID=294 RepID=A0A1T2XZE3_PSEFL|nr:serine/threonine-protein kinase [Pseudomonas fluorescens]OPA85208.1 serine/threonine protein kinase [Pseudomonas fluorescens]
MRDGLAPCTLLAGRYQLERELGRGGMGVVYRARDLLHEQFGEPTPWVAVKLLGEAISGCPDAHVLLYSEFALTRSLSHARVVRAFSFEVDTPRQAAFFIMELMHGITLDRLLQECPEGLPWRELQPMAVQLLEALAYIHQQQVLHGDIKPSNIMVGEAGVRLFDFGLGHGQAQVTAGLPSLSRNRFNAWTPAYAAPELLAGGVLTAACDLYGAACVLYALAYGKRLEDRQLTQKLARPRQLPRQCWHALRVALSVDPQRRNISVAQLAEVWGGHRRFWSL